MALVRVRRMAQVTLPAEVRRALNVKEGDYLTAEIVGEGVLLRPVAVVERERAWEGIRSAVSQVHDLGARHGEDSRSEEEEIAAAVKAHRRAKDRG
jgi:AbrB family looped-hinge helix DNA binding protein